MGIIRGVWDFIEYHLVEILIVIITIVMLGCLTFSAKVESDWRKWAEKHCEVIGVKSSQVATGTTVSTGGKVGVGTYVIPGQTQYSCDDGITYWR